MKINFLKPIVLALLILGVFQLKAQDKIIQGVVTTFDSIVVIGADVQAKSSKLVVKTDTLGQFNITVSQSDKLKISAKGFITTHVKLNEKTKLVAVNLKLKPGDKAREYAVGYGYVKDAERLNAVSQMTSDDVDFSQYSNFYDLIRGRFAGVEVRANGDIIVRGVNSINSSSAALIVLDGVQVNQSVVSSLSPINIKSIDVIKDGSAAIYGSRGANGVVLIETKRGND
ncbi:TonB-dependent receptor plug domain-containing protein [Prolixibacteraceae bacterium Z1-6]|uniref:TonB-dependent receptor plug domain-containing protein n=1 Tax=Draconibacterium aestuarii TaxID=2998507 RepID=A0A9X3F335_9BACT|nr:TonB-dependent receptor plug domain-containing protein [Prolixibacteraceae bacterium Z1-6]